MKKLLDKFYDSPFWVHFIVYAMIAFPFTMLCFYLMTSKGFNIAITEKILTGELLVSAIIGILFGLIGALTNLNGKRNDKFFAKMTEFRQKAKTLKTAMELHELKNELTLYWQKSSCGHPHARSVANDIYTLIEARMEFEFKIPQS